MDDNNTDKDDLEDNKFSKTKTYKYLYTFDLCINYLFYVS